MSDTADSLVVATPPPQRLIGSPREPGYVQLHQALPLVERQHALIEELRACSGRHLPCAVLAERTGTSTRTVERDIDRLRAAGVPIDRRRGPLGGYQLMAPAAAAAITFTAGEVAALVASLVALGPYTSATAQSAMQKLLRTFDGEASG